MGHCKVPFFSKAPSMTSRLEKLCIRRSSKVCDYLCHDFAVFEDVFTAGLNLLVIVTVPLSFGAIGS